MKQVIVNWECDLCGAKEISSCDDVLPYRWASIKINVYRDGKESNNISVYKQCCDGCYGVNVSKTHDEHLKNLDSLWEKIKKFFVNGKK